MLDTQEIDLEAERERLREKMDDVAEEQVGASGDHAEQLLIEGNELNNQREILGLVAEEWGVETVTLKGLSAGDVNRVEDTVERYDTVKERDSWVALGTVDAPYVDHDPGNVSREAYEDTVRNVANLPLAYVRWAEGKISELSHLGQDEGNAYFELVEEKREASQTGNG